MKHCHTCRHSDSYGMPDCNRHMRNSCFPEKNLWEPLNPPARTDQSVDWKRLYELEVKKKQAIYDKYERDIAKLPRIVPMEALSAAKAVSEPKLGAAVGELASPEYDQLRARVQPQAQGEAFHVEHRTNAHSEVCDKNGRAYAECSWGTDAAARAAHICALLNRAHPQASEPACDRAYLNGLRAGFGYGISGDEAGYQKSANSYRAMLAAAPGVGQ